MWRREKGNGNNLGGEPTRVPGTKLGVDGNSFNCQAITGRCFSLHFQTGETEAQPKMTHCIRLQHS